MKKLTEQEKEIVRGLYSKIQRPELRRREYDIDEKGRNPFERDYARVLYSSSFRRLQGKMQILGIKSSAFFRNRLTHSLEVCHIARSIARRLADECGSMYDNDLYVVEAAALAHDIGHPAFGHSGERVLANLPEGMAFEGNAQNFRLLRRLELKEAGREGLNLTMRTLLAINKYIVCEGGEAKKFLYKDDYDFLMLVRRECDLTDERTLDVQIVELADDIAYAVHDLEDALSQRIFTLHELIFELGKRNKKASQQFEIILDEALKAADKVKDKETSTLQEFSKILYRTLSSVLTDKFIRDIGVNQMPDEFCVKHGVKNGAWELSLCEYDDLCHVLSKTIFQCATRQPDIALYELRGSIVLRSLYNLYSSHIKNLNASLLPPVYRDVKYKEGVFGAEQLRLIIDFLAGMMDTFAIKTYEDYFHVGFNDIAVDTRPSVIDSEEAAKKSKGGEKTVGEKRNGVQQAETVKLKSDYDNPDIS